MYPTFWSLLHICIGRPMCLNFLRGCEGQEREEDYREGEKEALRFFSTTKVKSPLAFNPLYSMSIYLL